MSEDRKQAGAPVEQAEATNTQVLAAVERAAEVAAPAADANASGATADAADAPATDGDAAKTVSSSVSTSTSERPVIAQPTEAPSAGKLETAEEIFAAHPPREGGAASVAAGAAATAVLAEETPAATEVVATETAGAPAAELSPARDGEIRISADHPMAALYMQSPMPPEMRGNRGAGVLIALLGAVAFALVYAGVLALWIAPSYPPSTFLSEGLLPLVLSWGFAAAVVGFFVGFVLLVLIVGRAGWWAYVLGGLLVAIFTWGATLAGSALGERFSGEVVSLQPLSLLSEYGLIFPVLIAGIVAREVSVWFGAWIGARGRKMKRLNAEAITEYETALAEVRAKQP